MTKHVAIVAAMTVHTNSVFDWDTLKLESSDKHEYTGPVAQMMAAPADYLDAADLKNALSGGVIREDVLSEIFDLSDIPTEFLDAIGTTTHDNQYSEWTEDVLANPDTANARVSGSDNPGTNNATTPVRKGNNSQISTKKVELTHRSQDVNSIGSSGGMGYQTGRRTIELRRDIEAIALSNQASVVDDNNTTAGKCAGLGAIIATNDSFGAGGASGGFNTTTKLVDAPTAGNKRALSWAFISTQILACYKKGAMPTIFMAVPELTQLLGKYLVSTTQTTQVKPVANISGTAAQEMTMNSFVDAFKTDFGFLMRIVPNRLQQTYTAADTGAVTNCYGIDPRYIKFSTMGGWRIDPLAKVGLSDRKLLSVDWTIKYPVEYAHFCIRDINPASAVTD